MTCRRSRWIMFQYQSGHRNGEVEVGGRECMCWMQMVLNCCLCFPSGMKHSLPLSFRQCAVGLMFWVNELSVHPSPAAAAPPPSCFHFLLKVEMLVRRLWSPSCSGVSHFASSAHPDASGGAITNPHMQSRLAMHMIPFAFHCCFSGFFFFGFFFPSALLAMTHGEGICR